MQMGLMHISPVQKTRELHLLKILMKEIIQVSEAAKDLSAITDNDLNAKADDEPEDVENILEKVVTNSANVCDFNKPFLPS